MPVVPDRLALRSGGSPVQGANSKAGRDIVTYRNRPKIESCEPY